MPCDCGAVDCPSCGPAQGYAVTKIFDYRTGRYVYINPDEEDEDENYDPEEEEERT